MIRRRLATWLATRPDIEMVKLAPELRDVLAAWTNDARTLCTFAGIDGRRRNQVAALMLGRGAPKPVTDALAALAQKRIADAAAHRESVERIASRLWMCSACGLTRPRRAWTTGRDFFQNTYIAGCPCGAHVSPGDATMSHIVTGEALPAFVIVEGPALPS